MSPRRAALAAALVLAVPGALLAQPPQSPPPEPPRPANPGGEIQTPDRAGTASVGVAASAPLHDLNITRQAIPPVLLSAITNPYDAPKPMTCAVIGRQVAELDRILGADFDQPETPQQPSLTLHNGKIALALLRGASEMLLPFAGFVRTITGAAHHDQLVIEAITAGSVRRGYLKGLGERLRCPLPARPVHFLRPPPPAREDGPAPQYPIR